MSVCLAFEPCAGDQPGTCPLPGAVRSLLPHLPHLPPRPHPLAERWAAQPPRRGVRVDLRCEPSARSPRRRLRERRLGRCAVGPARSATGCSSSIRPPSSAPATAQTPPSAPKPPTCRNGSPAATDTARSALPPQRRDRLPLRWRCRDWLPSHPVLTAWMSPPCTWSTILLNQRAALLS
jgi:hypothetical protein